MDEIKETHYHFSRHMQHQNNYNTPSYVIELVLQNTITLKCPTCKVNTR
jgi:hypothetical protein